MFPADSSTPDSVAGSLADSIRARQQRLGTPGECAGDFAEICDLLHAWNNARATELLARGARSAEVALNHEPPANEVRSGSAPSRGAPAEPA